MQLVAWICALVLLALSSSLMRISFDGIAQRPSKVRKEDPPPLARNRKYFFYAGVYLNFVALCVLVEQSGGLVASPFSAVLLGMILGSQQLSRFRTNSRNYILAAFIAVAALVVYEYIFGLREVEHAPERLAFAILCGSFLVPALCAHADKPPNYRALGGFPPAALVEIYSDGHGVWRYCFHAERTRLDSPVEFPETASRDSLEDAKTTVHARWRSSLPILDRDRQKLIWEDDSSGTESLGRIVSVHE